MLTYTTETHIILTRMHAVDTHTQITHSSWLFILPTSNYAHKCPKTLSDSENLNSKLPLLLYLLSGGSLYPSKWGSRTQGQTRVSIRHVCWMFVIQCLRPGGCTNPFKKSPDRKGWREREKEDGLLDCGKEWCWRDTAFPPSLSPCLPSAAFKSPLIIVLK